VHWPCSSDPADEKLQTAYKDWNFIDTWKEMEKLDEKKARNLGISNFDTVNLDKLLPEATKVPAVNQIELHPNNPTPKLLKYLEDKKIHATAYSCLGSTNSPLASDQVIADIAKKHNTTTQAVLLVWGLQRGTSVIPKSVTPTRIEANWTSLDGLKLSDEEMETLSTRPDRFKVCGDSWLGPGNEVFHVQE
jgi:glycerol 2-dehydrogenase (NADP+)